MPFVNHKTAKYTTKKVSLFSRVSFRKNLLPNRENCIIIKENNKPSKEESE